MNQPIPAALANTVLLADHDEATQRAVVDAIQKIILHYLQDNMYNVSGNVVSHQQDTIERLALRALRQHLVNASNIY
jgi:hypothetical protein